MKANSGIPPMKDLLCAVISVYTCYVSIAEGKKVHNIDAKLAIGFTKKEYDNFIKKLDVEYDDGYGGQELGGTIWLKDGTWMDRGEYDGSEWWNHQVCPEIPDELEQSLKKV